MKIGFIGLGIMGSRMALNLINGGHWLIVYNRTKSKIKTLGYNKVSRRENPAEVGKEVNIIFTMLSTPEVVKEVALGKKGFLNTLSRQSIWIDCSTVNPSFSILMAAEAEKRKIRFIDAPVAGSKLPAQNAELIFLAGGNERHIKQFQPLFSLMGKDLIHVGPTGMGSAMKMVINTLLGQSMLAFSEAILFGESLGINKKLLFDTLVSLPVTAQFCVNKRSKLEKEDYSTEFPLQWMYKDLELASETAYKSGVSLPLLSSAKGIYGLANQRGYAKKDLSAVFEFLKEKK